MSYLNLTPDDLKFQQKKDNHISNISVLSSKTASFYRVPHAAGDAEVGHPLAIVKPKGTCQSARVRSKKQMLYLVIQLPSGARKELECQLANQHNFQ